MVVEVLEFNCLNVVGDLAFKTHPTQHRSFTLARRENKDQIANIYLFFSYQGADEFFRILVRSARRLATAGCLYKWFFFLIALIHLYAAQVNLEAAPQSCYRPDPQ